MGIVHREDCRAILLGSSALICWSSQVELLTAVGTVVLQLQDQTDFDRLTSHALHGEPACGFMAAKQAVNSLLNFLPLRVRQVLRDRREHSVPAAQSGAIFRRRQFYPKLSMNCNHPASSPLKSLIFNDLRESHPQEPVLAPEIS